MARTDSGKGAEKRQVAVIPCRPVVSRPELDVSPRRLPSKSGGAVSVAQPAASSRNEAEGPQRGQHFWRRRRSGLPPVDLAPRHWPDAVSSDHEATSAM